MYKISTTKLVTKIFAKNHCLSLKGRNTHLSLVQNFNLHNIQMSQTEDYLIYCFTMFQFFIVIILFTLCLYFYGKSSKN